jgi:hypothetical protein
MGGTGAPTMIAYARRGFGQDWSLRIQHVGGTGALTMIGKSART